MQITTCYANNDMQNLGALLMTSFSHAPRTPRQAEILALARRQGHVEVEALADLLRVTPQTIRRDLKLLCDGQALHRVHGGAMHRVSTVSNVAYESRQKMAAVSKHAIGSYTASLIPDKSSLIMNIGTTTEQAALALQNRKGLLVVTNNLNIADIFRSSSEVELIIAGGHVRTSDCAVVGQSAIDFIRQFSVDYAIIGASAIDHDGTFLDYDYREVCVTQAIMACARQTILLVDSSKFTRKAPVRIGNLSKIDVLVTDKPIPDHLASLCDTHNTRIEIAPILSGVDQTI